MECLSVAETYKSFQILQKILSRSSDVRFPSDVSLAWIVSLSLACVVVNDCLNLGLRLPKENTAILTLRQFWLD